MVHRLILGGIASFLLLLNSVTSQTKVEVLHSGPDRLVVDLHPMPPERINIVIDGLPYVSFVEAVAERDNGLPSESSGLPASSFLIGLPQSGDPLIRVLSAHSVMTEGIRIATAKMIDATPHAGMSTSASYEPARVSTLGPTVVLSTVTIVRGLRIGTVTVIPFSYDAVSNTMTSFDDIRIEVIFPAPGGGSNRDDLHFDSFFERRIVNYREARQWKSPPIRGEDRLSVPSTQTAVTSNLDWFDPSKRYIKIPVAVDGLYQVTYADIQSAGVQPESVDPSMMSVFHRGIPLSIRMMDDGDGQFEATDTLEFYGTRLFDSPRMLNEFTDTSSYWLALDDNRSPQSVIDSVVISPAADTADHFSSPTMSNRDLFYYFGDQGLPNNNQTAKVPGEGWYRTTIRAGQGTNVGLTLNDIYTTGSPTFTARVHVHSSVFDQVTPNHVIEFLANGIVVGSGTLEGYEDKMLTFAGPVSLLTGGANTFRVQSIATGASISDVLLDWVEVTFPRRFQARADSIMFLPDKSTPGEVVRFVLRGFTTNDISVYRVDSLGNIEKTFRGAITSSSGTFVFAFTDTVISGRSYFGLRGSRKRRPSALIPKSFVGLRNAALGADYLIVTAPPFLPEANRLAQFRVSKGIGRTYVALMDDIRDEFDHGEADPESIRRFVRMCDSLWFPPSPAYLLLMGDGNWDARNLLGGNRQNFVPVMGNPVSDALFVASDANPFVPTKFVGRIPVRTPEQAAKAVDDIIAYESTPIERWHKRYMFMAGGFDSVETKRFTQFSDGLISQYVRPAPLAGNPSRFYRTLNLVFTPEEAAAAAAVIDAGAIWINYYGHGGTDLWGNGIDQPSHLRNASGHRHVISDISCSTVRFAEPLIESFAEDLLFGGEGGAIAYFGSSGFGYESPLQSIARSLYAQVAGGGRILGPMLLAAKLNLWGSGSTSMITRGAMQQYTLLGDPALRIAVPTKPDYFVEPESFRTTPAIPTESDSAIVVEAVIGNLGIQTNDSLRLTVDHTRRNASSRIFDVRRPSIANADTLHITSDLIKGGGVHALRLTVDEDDDIDEVSESNNESTYELFINSSTILPIQPQPFASRHPDSVTIVLQNSGLPTQGTWRMTVEVDSFPGLFHQPLLRKAGIPRGTVGSLYRVPAGFLASGGLYAWRARFEGDGDSTNWIDGTVLADADLRASWVQDRSGAIANNASSGLAKADTVRLSSRTIEFEVTSAGFSDGNRVAMKVDGVDVSLGFANRGYNVAVFDEHTGDMLSFAAFSIYSDTPDTTLSYPLIAHLQSIPFGRRVIVAIADEGRNGKGEGLNREIEMLGSAMIRQVGFRQSWAIIGWKGAPIGSVPEMRKASGTGPAVIADTIDFLSVEGRMTSPAVDVVSAWKSVSFDVDTSASGTHASLDVIRTLVSGGIDTLSNAHLVPSVEAYVHPGTTRDARLHLRLRSDSAGLSPSFTRWWVVSKPVPELVIGETSVSRSADSVVQGNPFNVTAQVFNIGEANAESIVVRTTMRSLISGAVQVIAEMIPSLASMDSSVTTFSFTTLDAGGLNSVTVEVDPSSAIDEAHISNNTYSFPLTVLPDTLRPFFSVTFDGSSIFDGDYISSHPTIRVEMNDDNPTPVTDPSNFVVRLNDVPVSLGSSPDSLFEPGTATTGASVTYRPSLRTGVHTLSVQVKDVTGNEADTVARAFQFRVREEPGLLNVMNFPNPFARSTKFTFNIVGSRLPDEFSIRIYTVAGRLIEELRVPPSGLRMGFNAIDWDGRSRDGDPVANGVYLYKLLMKVDGKTEEVVEKMARVR